MSDKKIESFNRHMRGDIFYNEASDEFLEKAKQWGCGICMAIGTSENDELFVGANVSELKDIQWILHRAVLFIDEHIKSKEPPKDEA